MNEITTYQIAAGIFIFAVIFGGYIGRLIASGALVTVCLWAGIINLGEQQFEAAVAYGIWTIVGVLMFSIFSKAEL